MREFAYLTSSASLPLRVRAIQDQLRRERQARVREMIEPPDETDTNFTLEELRATHRSTLGRRVKLHS